MQNSTLQLHMVLQPDRRPAELGALVYRKMSFVAQSLDRRRTIATEMERQRQAWRQGNVLTPMAQISCKEPL